LLQNAGKASSAVAKQLARNEYEKFRVIQYNDFDKSIKKITGKK